MAFMLNYSLSHRAAAVIMQQSKQHTWLRASGYVSMILSILGLLLSVGIFIIVIILVARSRCSCSDAIPSSAHTRMDFLSLETPRLGASAFNGIADGTVHSFAGKMVRAMPGETCDSKQAYGYGCSATLVSIPGLPDRRVVITAGHCAAPGTLSHTRYVTFDEIPAATLTSCSGAVRFVDLNFTRWYRVKKAWSAYAFNQAALKSDWAVLLLDDIVDGSIVPNPAVIISSSDQKDLTQKTLPVTGMAGYGIEGYGPDGQVDQGRPLAVLGSGRRTYVEMAVSAVTADAIIISANAALDDPNACSGDSGSAAFIPTNGAPWSVVGMFSLGDRWCRATRVFTRLDVPEYRAWLQSIKTDILNNA
jgi:hypothetical protein